MCSADTDMDVLQCGTSYGASIWITRPMRNHIPYICEAFHGCVGTGRDEPILPMW